MANWKKGELVFYVLGIWNFFLQMDGFSGGVQGMLWEVEYEPPVRTKK